MLPRPHGNRVGSSTVSVINTVTGQNDRSPITRDEGSRRRRAPRAWSMETGQCLAARRTHAIPVPGLRAVRPSRFARSGGRALHLAGREW